MRLLVCCAISVHCRNVVQLLDTGRLDYVKDEGAAPVNERWCSVEPLGRDSGKCGPDYAHCYVRNVCACVRGKLENGGLFSTTNFNLDQCPDLVVQHGYYGLESGTTHTQPASRASMMRYFWINCAAERIFSFDAGSIFFFVWLSSSCRRHRHHNHHHRRRHSCGGRLEVRRYVCTSMIHWWRIIRLVDDGAEMLGLTVEWNGMECWDSGW